MGKAKCSRPGALAFKYWKSGDTVTVAENTGSLERTGYAFAGRSLTDGGTAISSFAIAADTDLYPLWSAIEGDLMIQDIEVNGTGWTPITTAGQTGKVWMNEDDKGLTGKGDVRVNRSSSGLPASSVPAEGKKVYKPSGNNDVVNLDAANDEVWYARCKNASDVAMITVDVI
jgi:hypothetical protein